MSEIIAWSAGETAENLKSKSVSVREVTEAHLARLAQVNPKINAVTDVVKECLDLASSMDAKHPGKDAPGLWGVPVTTKINADQKGYANSNGLPAYKDNTCTEDSAVVANLKSAGAVVIGRTNTPEFSMRWFTSNPLHGVSLNPWDPEVTPGGSSGAAAAAVAAGIGAIAHGNDLGGSLRYPAFCCGVATIRPSMGRVPAFNPSAVSERPPVTMMMSAQGPIARTVADVRLGLSAMAAQSTSDPMWVNAPNSGRKHGEKIRVGYNLNPFAVGTYDPAIESAMTTAREGLQAAGIEVVEVPLPGADRAANLWGEILFTETSILMGEAIRDVGSQEMRQLFDTYGEQYPPLDLTGFLNAMSERTRLQRQVSKMFEDIDLFMMPTSLLRPLANDLDFKSPDEVPGILDAMKPLHAVNLLGLPAVALPTGVADGLPVGVQIMAPMHDDYFALEIAERLEREIGTIIQGLRL